MKNFEFKDVSILAFCSPSWCCALPVMILVKVNGRNTDTRAICKHSGHMRDQWVRGRVYVLIIVLTCVTTVSLKYNLVKILPIMWCFLWVGMFLDDWKLKVERFAWAIPLQPQWNSETHPATT